MSDPRGTIGIAYSSKDRVEFTRQTLPQLLKAPVDVHWVDGSVTEEGKAELHNHKVTDIHPHITGGADLAIVYSLSMLVEKGYDYIGLVENDVLLHDGWFEACMKLFETPDLKVGGVSARCYSDRILVNCDNFAIMNNVGAGMQILTREAACHVLSHYRNGSFGEYAFWPTYLTGQRPPVPQEVEALPNKNCFLTADWFFESSYMRHGLACLAVTPSMAHNIDGYQAKNQVVASKRDPSFLYDKFLKNLNEIKPVPSFGHFDPAFKFWTAQPHQIVQALPDAFAGSWKLWWAKHNGPFGLETTAGNESLSLPFTGSNMSILMLTGDQPVKINARVPSGTSVLEAKASDQLDWVRLNFAEFDCEEIELSFDRPGVKVATMGFDNPQPWFRDAYRLSYNDLKPFLRE